MEPALFSSGTALAPPPTSPVGFSAEMERVFLLELSQIHIHISLIFYLHYPVAEPIYVLHEK